MSMSMMGDTSRSRWKELYYNVKTLKKYSLNTSAISLQSCVSVPSGFLLFMVGLTFSLEFMQRQKILGFDLMFVILIS